MSKRIVLMCGTVVMFISGCIGAPKYLPDDTGKTLVPQPDISICELKANAQRLVGRRMTVEALYESDATRYEFFKDATCKGGGILSVSYTKGTGDASVTKFYQDWRDHCRHQGLNYCAQTATVTSDVAIVIEESGVATVEILKVWRVVWLD